MKFWDRLFKNQRLYTSLLLSLIISAVATLLISSAILYFNFERISLEQVYTDNMLNLKQTSRAVSTMAETAFNLASQIYNDFNVNKIQYYKAPDIYDVRGAFTQLDRYRMSSPFLESIYVFNGRNKTFYVDAGINSSYKFISRESIQSAGGFDDPEVVRIIAAYKKHPPFIPIPRRLVFRSLGTSVNYYTFFLYEIFSEGALNSAVIVNIHENWIHQFINGDAKTQGETFIINSGGRLVSNTASHPMLTDLRREESVQQILRHPDTAGYFTVTLNGVRSLVSYTEPDSFGWRYIRTTPLKAIFSKIEKARQTTILISFLILVAGLCGAYFMSRRLYAPIDQILTDIKNLEKAKIQNDAAVKQEYLRSVIQGQDNIASEQYARQFQDLEINLDATAPFAVVMFKIDNYHNYTLKYSSKEKNLFKEALLHTPVKFFNRQWKAEPVDMGHGCLVFVINIPDLDRETADPRGDLLETVKSIQGFIAEHLKISISVTVSSSGESAASLGSLYNQVAEASLHRLFYGHGSVIDAEKTNKFKTKEYVYPTNKEKLLVEALLAGNIQEVKQIYLEIIAETADYSFAAFNLALSHLIVTINNTLNIIQKNNTLTESYAVKPLALLNDLETITEINRHFFELFDDIKTSLDKKRSLKQENLVKRVQEIIQTEYANPDLSVEYIANTLDLTISYICRIFKQHTLNTILDDIVRVRMTKAQELLCQTRLSVSEIAAKVGFASSSYFYRTFKKLHGVTPNDFRCAGLRREPLGDAAELAVADPDG